MKTLGIILFALAVTSGLCGLWSAMGSFCWAGYEAFTWNDDDEEED